MYPNTQFCLIRSNSVKFECFQGFTPIHYAALHGQLECLKMLIEKYKVDPNISTAEGTFPLILCIRKELRLQSFKCVQYLIRQGADVNW